MLAEPWPPFASTLDEHALISSVRAWTGGSAVTGDAANTMPRTPGAYAILFRLDERVAFSRRPGPHIFMPGGYIYAGSAYGPGGLRARIGRHLRPGKPLHWHIDHLTATAAAMWAVAVEGGEECAIVRSLTRSGLFTPALRGFGATDCPRCPAHLLQPVATG